MLTPEQIKGRIKNIAEKKDLRPQEVLQMFLFERVLERLSASEYKSNFILKGGLLISSMIGISERTTMDSVICVLQMALFCFPAKFHIGHKPAVLRGCWLLLYIKAVNRQKKKGASIC